MRASYLFTSESVSEGHPDKVADQISDTVVDAFLAADPYARVACETLVTTNRIVLAGEVRGPDGVIESLEAKIRAVIRTIGYEQDGFHWKHADYACHLHAQSTWTSPWASMRTATRTRRRRRPGHHVRLRHDRNARADAGDAGQYSHNILRVLADARHAGERPELRARRQGAK